MAVIGIRPRLHRVITDRHFQRSAAKGLSTGFTTLVRKGTYPRSGMDHPNLAIGDRLEFILSERGLRLLDSRRFYRRKNHGVYAVPQFRYQYVLPNPARGSHWAEELKFH